MMKVLITGSNGQLGRTLRYKKPSNIELIALTRDDLDLSSEKSINEIIKFHQPEWVINAGAYTSVDLAEDNQEIANQINANAPKLIAKCLSDIGGKLLHISTDYVFDGKQSHPYEPNQTTNPINVYGLTKAKGEKEATKLGNTKIIRTSWLYGPMGKNFLTTMLKLHSLKAEKSEPLFVVSDQIGSPTSTLTLAEACWKSLNIKEDSTKIIHWSDSGCASWYDLAVAIGELGVKSELISKSANVKPIKAKDYPRKAKRPYNSMLDCSASEALIGINQYYWRFALWDTLVYMKENKFCLD